MLEAGLGTELASHGWWPERRVRDTVSHSLFGSEALVVSRQTVGPLTG